MNKLSFAVAVALCGLSLLGGESVDLVAGGAPKACIVLADDAPKYQKYAADEFVRWTKELTGAEIPVGPAARDGLTPISFEIVPDDGKIEYDGFRLTAAKDGIKVVAKEPFGILYSAFWVLNRFGKVYWFDPESGADFAKTSGFAIPAGTHLENPLPDREGLRPGGCPGPILKQVMEWNVRNGFQPKGREWCERFGLPYRASRGGHSLGDMVVNAPVDKAELEAEVARIKESGEADKFLNPPHNAKKGSVERLARFNLQLKKHPNRFPVVNGVRSATGVSLRGPYKGGVGNACMSGEECREYLLGAIRAAKESECAKGAKRFEYGFMCDDNSQWCECDECLKLIKGKGASTKDDRTSDYWWDLVNWMTPRLLEDKDVSVETAIYLNYRQPPTKVKPLIVDKERQSVLICPHGRCYLHSLTNAACKSNGRYVKMFKDWIDIGIPIRTFEYHCQLPGKGNYAFIEKAWVEDLKWYRANHISHTAGGLFGPWMIYGGWTEQQCPMYKYGAKARWQIIYLTGHFEWDTDDDFETVRTDVLTRYYRAAAKEMLEYHRLLEDAIYRPNICMSYGSSGMPFTVAASEPGFLDKAKGLLKAADAKAGDDAELKRRIERDRQNLYRDWESAAATAASVKSSPLPRAKGAIALDGVLDETDWTAAAVSDDFRWAKTYNVDFKANMKYEPHTKMLLTYDNDNLYLGFECAKTKGRPEKDVPDDGSTFAAMNGGHLEIIVQSPAQNGEYFHLGLSHNGKTYSAQTLNPTTRDLKKKCAFRHAIKDAPDKWTAELALPLKDFGAIPKAGEVWKVCAYRLAPGKDGGNVEGTSTGFPLHWMDRWEAFSFGTPGDLVKNGSFEFGAPHPATPYNGKNWIFRQSDAPEGWNYHQNGGDLDWREGDAAEGRRYIRVTPINEHGGPEFMVTPSFALYPPATKTLKASFSARGTGMIRIYSFSHKELTPVEVKISSKDWKRYEADIPLCGTHPTALTVRFISQKKDPIDFDNLVIVR